MVVLPRNTVNGTRIGAWHLLQTTRMESADTGVGVATGGLGAFAAA